MVNKFAKKPVEATTDKPEATDQKPKKAAKPAAKKETKAAPKPKTKAEKPKKETKPKTKAEKPKKEAVAKGITIEASDKVTPVRSTAKVGVLLKALAAKTGATMETLIDKLSESGIKMDDKKVKGRIQFELRRTGYGVRTEVNADPMKTKFFLVYPKGVSEVAFK